MAPGVRRRRTWLRGLVLLYAAALAAVEISRWVGPERWWLTCLNLYLPQVAWAAPGVLLCLLTLGLDRRFTLAPVLCLAWALGPIMGLSLPVGRPTPSPERAFRVMTYNVKYGRQGVRNVAAEVQAADPDLLLLQDVYQGTVAHPALAGFMRTRHVEQEGFYVVASRFPLEPIEYRRMGRDWYVRTAVTIAGQSVAVYNVHLMTPRDGLEALREWSRAGIDELMDGARDRLDQVEQLNADLDRERGPVLLAGDLNAPPGSLVVRRLRSDRFRDAFETAGRGYGFTYGHRLLVRASYLRIDHILYTRELVALRTWVGGGAGSDHRPVLSEMALAGPGS
jgi:vancomycin resistance protein VanJ